ncbi:putative phage abortive infection protein [Aliivibrio fischeri]|uniref:Uncharacterized protein n=1 Tax=Aliivibrio fischeri SR5 TaxID=1088719 RepID=A0AAV3ESR5_ALIFS|nr:putative phage abortive infection protein [Aliivibrio fischeri]EHN69910.1 hypothetical protein VFSR5_1546 [Aliivibrio fischeri SR5]
MIKLERNLRYNGFTGSIYSKPNGFLYGEVEEIEKNNSYEGRTFKELEQQFKNRINYFYEQHAAMGIKPQQSKKNHLFILVLASLFLSSVGIIWYLWGFYINEMPIVQFTNQAESTINIKMEWWDKASSFLNNLSAPTLSFLSFIALLYTIYLQNKSYRLSLKELALTREELEMTRKEIEKTTIANQEQADALKSQVIEAQNRAIEQRQLAQEQQRITQVQQFENTFFSLLANHEKSLNKITESKHGKSIADEALTNLKNKRNGDRTRSYNFFEYNEITSYFIVLYQLLKFIKKYPHTEGTDDNDKLLIEKKYTSLIRAYIPNDVLMLILFNCVVDENSDKKFNYFKEYKSIIERYSFLEHVSIEYYYNDDLKLIANSYSISNCAFGNNVGEVKLKINYLVIMIFNEYIIGELRKTDFFDYEKNINSEILLINNLLTNSRNIEFLYKELEECKCNVEASLKSENIKEEQVHYRTLARLRRRLIQYYDGKLYPEVKNENSGTCHYFEEDELKFILNELEIAKGILDEKRLTSKEVTDKENKIQILEDNIKVKRLNLENLIKEDIKANNLDFGLNKDGILLSELRYYIGNR